MDSDAPATFDTERKVIERYAGAAQERDAGLCCAVDYDPQFLKVIPQEIRDKDYGCGDPSRYLGEGDVVLDLGSGGGKICYIASQIVGPKGRVIGVDFNPAMLSLARKYKSEVAAKIGWDNVDFRYGKIQDLRTDYEAPEESRARQAAVSPLVGDGSVDVIVSNCVLNLVRSEDKAELFHEMYRVLKTGGRVAISDIVSDLPVPQALRDDPDLWAGCISGAFQEQDFLRAFEDAGFQSIQVVARDEEPWQAIDGIEFRSLTVMAGKGVDVIVAPGPAANTKSCC